MQNQLQKIINFSRKTGDRVIVFSQDNPDESYVVMKLEEYEELVNNNGVQGLTEEELLDKINRDIAIWKNENSQEDRSHEDILGKRFSGSVDENVEFSELENLQDESDEDEYEDDYDLDNDTFYYEDVDDKETAHNNKSSEKKIDNTENKEEDREFETIKDSIEKRRKSWNIPKNVKNSAV